MCLSTLGTYAQDDDVYFVPSSKDRTATTEPVTAGRSSYTGIPETESQQQTYESSHWADHRGNGHWDVDAYNRRGRNYKGQAYASGADTTSTESCCQSSAKSTYDAGYDDGYEDGYFTSRLVRFWSPRVGIYVSSPFYMDYYDLCYDPFYYGYASPWYGWGWSGWYGWGSWYGWRPYYNWGWNWGWGGWHSPWYDPWWGPNYAFHPGHWYPSNAQRGPVGGYVAYGGSRGTGRLTGTANRNSFGLSSRPSSNFGGLNRGTAGRTDYSGATRPSRNFGTSSQPSRSYNNNRQQPQRTEQSRPSRSFGNSNGSSSPSRSYSAPSRSSGSFGGGGSFGSGRSFGGGGGGRSFGGRR